MAPVQPVLSRTSGLTAAALCISLLLAGCGGASAPRSAVGVRGMYRSIGLDASSGEFTDICDSYMDPSLRDQFKPALKECLTTSFERWAERIRTPGLSPGTRIVVSGSEARVYRAARPERALYLGGQWLLAEVPAAILPRHK